MRKVFASMGITALLLFVFSLTAASNLRAETWKGWISDSACAAKGTNAQHKDCALKCIHEKGAKFVLVNSDTKEVMPIHNQDAVKDSDLGMEVNVTGHLTEDKSLHVDSIAPASGT